MFKNTSIITSPILPAKTLAIYCYYEMFAYCTSLQKIYLYAEDISAQNCLNNWLYRASDDGIIYNYTTLSE